MEAHHALLRHALRNPLEPLPSIAPAACRRLPPNERVWIFRPNRRRESIVERGEVLALGDGAVEEVVGHAGGGAGGDEGLVEELVADDVGEGGEGRCELFPVGDEGALNGFVGVEAPEGASDLRKGGARLARQVSGWRTRTHGVGGVEFAPIGPCARVLRSASIVAWEAV